ncbi:WbqC family protein [Pseudomonadota bacterium]
MKTIGIIQPSYLPWRGFFDFIHEVDVFVFLDDVQYTTRDWRSRNKIKTKDGKTIWLSVPITGGRHQLIKDVQIDYSTPWVKKHLNSLQHNYAKTDYFDLYYPKIKHLLYANFSSLSHLDIALTTKIAELLGITTEFMRASELNTTGSKDDKLVEIVKRLDGNSYLSGPAARNYLRPELWKEAGILLAYKDYSGYPQYQQISEPFEPNVSVLDLLFSTGTQAPEYIWGKFRNRRNF